MKKERDIENNGFMPQKGNPLHETVAYKIGGTIYEVSTICGGSELLYIGFLKRTRSTGRATA